MPVMPSHHFPISFAACDNVILLFERRLRYRSALRGSDVFWTALSIKIFYEAGSRFFFNCNVRKSPQGHKRASDAEQHEGIRRTDKISAGILVKLVRLKLNLVFLFQYLKVLRYDANKLKTKLEKYQQGEGKK
jgi:hypothetical protein